MASGHEGVDIPEVINDNLSTADGARYVLRVVGHVPAKANAYRIVRGRGGSRLVKDDGVVAFEAHVALVAKELVRQVGGTPFPAGTAVEVWLIWHRRDHDGRRRDLDNIAKATLDALTAAALWDDDRQVTTQYMTVRWDGGGEEWLDIVVGRDPAQPSPQSKKRRSSSSRRTATTPT